MPYREIRVILSSQAVEKIGPVVRSTLRQLFPGVVIAERDGGDSDSIVLDVQSVALDRVTQETYFESKGPEAVAHYEQALRKEIRPVP